MNYAMENAGSQSTSVETLSFEMFMDELRHVARFIKDAAPANPLEAVLKAITDNPALNQARLLTRVLAACIGRQVSFRRADVAAFDNKHLSLMLALMKARDTGNLDAAEWTRVADAADAAQREIDG